MRTIMNTTLSAFALSLAVISGSVVSSASAQESERDAMRAPRGTEPFSKEVYAARREALMKELGPGVAIIQGARDVISGRQDHDFAYLTGITDEGNATLILFSGENAPRRETLLLEAFTPEDDVWSGEHLPSGEALRERTGIANVSRAGAIDSVLPGLAARNPEFFYLGRLVGPNRPIPPTLELMRSAASRIPGAKVTNKSTVLPNMRARKEPRELELMKKAIAATEAGLKDAMSQVHPGMMEYELQHIIEGGFRREGAVALAFPTIVGSGPNSAILHYERNDRRIGENDLVLCDVGSEYKQYASDVTRTFPASGKFTARQREIYDIVLEAQRAAVSKLKAGAFMREDVQGAAEDVFRKYGLRDDFKHGIGHFVGLDVHDAGDYLNGLPEGSVVTVEPGIYLPAEGFGVRIEDEYLVTKNGAVHLTGGVPSDPDEIEALMAAARE